METSQSSLWKTFVRIVAFLLAVILMLLDVLGIRNALLSFLTWDQTRIIAAQRAQGTTGSIFRMGAAIQTIDLTSIIVLGIAAIAAVIWIEYYYRFGAKQGKLYKRIGIVTAVEVAIILIAFILSFVFA
ncbi:MAG: hypothetical protein M1434_05505 [Chloroflexi bacterium]|nr:hypothetical protein [Chloroflexota bacterium]MCL5274191.1 hypothetical protein [Chloroflexota bacterium]